MRARHIAISGLVLSAAALLAGCNSVSAPPPVEATPTPTPTVAALPAPGVIGSSIGQSLDETDRAAAIAAQQDAVASGSRKSWRGARGASGFITPGTETGGCRDYTHRIFINGRPQEAKGRACQENGAWRVTS